MNEIPDEIARLIAEAEAEERLQAELAAERERQRLEDLTKRWVRLTELVKMALPLPVGAGWEVKIAEEMEEDCIASSTSFRVDLLIPGLAPIRTVVSREKPVLESWGNYRVMGMNVCHGRKFGYMVACADVNEYSDEVEFWFNSDPDMVFEDLPKALLKAKRVMERKIMLEEQLARRPLVYENIEEPAPSIDLAAAESLRKLVRDEVRQAKLDA